MYVEKLYKFIPGSLWNEEVCAFHALHRVHRKAGRRSSNITFLSWNTVPILVFHLNIVSSPGRRFERSRPHFSFQWRATWVKSQLNKFCIFPVPPPNRSIRKCRSSSQTSGVDYRIGTTGKVWNNRRLNMMSTTK